MKLELKGLHKVKRQLSNGDVTVHFYAWRGGPKIKADPGTPAFVAEFAALMEARIKRDPYAGTLQELINAYQRDRAFTKLKEVTRKGYIERIRRIETQFGTMPINVLNYIRVRQDFLDWREQVANECGTREADYRIAVLARILSWSKNRGKIFENHLTNPERLHSGNRAEYVWKDDDIAKLRAVAPAHIDLPFTLGLETGQRQLNILRLVWPQYDGTYLRFKQTKTGRPVIIRLLPELRNRLDELRATQPGPYICVSSEGTPWTSDGFKTSFGRVKEKAGIINLTFHDTRGTAVLTLARAGSTLAEIASVTGHSMKHAAAILQTHYLGADKELSDAAMTKVEAYLAAQRALAQTSE